MPGSYAASVQSTAGTISSYARKMARPAHPDMEILLDHHHDGKVYTTFDALTGRVLITAPHAARFDEIQITLVGSIKSFLENVSSHSSRSRTSAKHTFLKMRMPIRESEYPQPRVAEARRTYEFAFHFVIPAQLLPKACHHPCAHDDVHAEHLQPPPSMGDCFLRAGDDLGPEMARVEYAIKVQVVRTRERDGVDVVLADGAKKIVVVPARPEAPPMSLATSHGDYVLRTTKLLRKGIFSGRLGRITLSAAQPRALVLPSPSAARALAAPQPTTTATIHLRFDPHDAAASQPPRLGALTTKITATTVWSTRPSASLPAAFSPRAIRFDPNRGVYSSSVSLNSRCVAAVAWTAHHASPAYTRRDSASSTGSSSDGDGAASSAPGAQVYYTASILVPITLPASKSWLPTFHSCIASRVYCIETTLTVRTPGTGVPASAIQLRLPVQIAADGHAVRRAPGTAAAAPLEAAATEADLRPRVRERPREDFISRSVLGTSSRVEAPPGYDDFVTRRVVSPTY